MASNDDITGLLKRFQQDDAEAQSELITALYEELRTMARRYMAREKPGHSLQTTALVHEAYLKLARMHTTEWQSRSHFFAAAAKVMRHILVDHARRYLAGDLGGRANLLPFEDELLLSNDPKHSLQILEVDRAVDKLSTIDERAGRVIELRFFGGLSIEETAEALHVAQRSVERDWTFARAWLRDELSPG